MARLDRRRTGAELRRELGLDAGGAPEAAPGFDDFADEVIFAGIWNRPGLSRADRMICTLAVVGPLQRLPQIESLTAAALDLGIPARSILEVFVQSGLYGGFITAENAARIAHGVFAKRGITVPPEPARDDTDESLDVRGRELLATLHGERGTRGYAAPGNAITGALYPSAIRYGYGELWYRPGLDHRRRMLVAIASFTALPLPNLLRKFSVSALNVGLRREEIVEAVIQTAPYGGFPRALEGLAILSEVLPEA
jgi:4-carboxymuconolactone decarboxylase